MSKEKTENEGGDDQIENTYNIKTSMTSNIEPGQNYLNIINSSLQ